MSEGKWTYKTLRFGPNGEAEWRTANFEFEKPYGAVEAAGAYMLACARRGHMVVVSLEPAAEYKAVAVRLNEHAVMLDELKRQYSDRMPISPETDLWTLIHKIDPDWPNPWSKHQESINGAD